MCHGKGCVCFAASIKSQHPFALSLSLSLFFLASSFSFDALLHAEFRLNSLVESHCWAPHCRNWNCNTPQCSDQLHMDMLGTGEQNDTHKQ
ncbi:hypothetical protein J3F84DRAFT_370898 [Trichoderma pleuroticola]